MARGEGKRQGRDLAGDWGRIKELKFKPKIAALHLEQFSESTVPLSQYGKFLIGVSQYQKGCAFVGAAILSKAKMTTEAHQYVYLHLICQGLELIVKGLLLVHNFEKFRPMERKFGHNIKLLVETALPEFKQKTLRLGHEQQLQNLSNLYLAHHLRYAGLSDIFINPTTIESDKVFRRLGAVVRMGNRFIALHPLSKG